MPGRRTREEYLMAGIYPRIWLDEEVPAGATAAAENETGQNMIDVAAAINRYQRELNTQPIPDNVVDPAAYANVVYRFNNAQFFTLPGQPVRCHKEPQATTPKGEFEMDAD